MGPTVGAVVAVGTVLAVVGAPAEGLTTPGATAAPCPCVSPDTPGAAPFNALMPNEPPRPESRRGDSETVPDKGSTSTPS